MGINKKINSLRRLLGRLITNPDYRALVRKFYSGLRETKKMEKELIRNLYSQLEDYEGKREEMHAVLSHKSRVSDNIVFETLAIYSANKGYRSIRTYEALHVGALGRIVSDYASMRDDVQDGFFRLYLANLDELSVEMIKERMKDEWFLDFAKTQKPILNKKTGRVLNPYYYAHGSYLLEKFFYEEIEKLDPAALKQYEQGKSEIEERQAFNLLLSAMMLKGDISGLFEVLGKDYYRALIKDLDRLAIMGEKWGVMVNTISWVDGQKELRVSNKNCGRFFKNLTRFSQGGIDDVPSVFDDIEDKAPTIMTVPMLKKYPSISVDNLRAYLKENPSVLDSRVFSPLINEIGKSLKALKQSLLEDAILGTRMVVKETERHLKELERSLDVRLSYEWLNIWKGIEQELEFKGFNGKVVDKREVIAVH